MILLTGSTGQPQNRYGRFAAANSPFRQEIIVSKEGQNVRRLAVHRTKTYNGGTLSAYYSAPRASISRDGRYSAYASNMGVPELASVYVANLGITTAQYLQSSVTPADTTALLNYVFPSGFTVGAATVTISTLPGLGSPVVSASDGFGSLARQYIAAGLTAGTQYYYRITTTGFAFTGQFRTTATLSGTGRLQISEGGGGTIGYGATSGLGSSCTSPCDLAVTRGLLYTNATGAVSALVVR